MHLTARKTRWSETCPRSGRLGFSRYPASLASSECGPDQASNGLRPESKARDIASPLLRGGRRSPACRRSGAKRQPNLEIRFPLTLLCRLMLGPLRAPSRTSRAPTACGQNQKRSRTSSLLQKLCRSRDSLLSTRGSCPGVASADGVGALLAGDLARSGSKTVKETPRPA